MKRFGRKLATAAVLWKCWSSRGSFPGSRWIRAQRPWPILPAKRSRRGLMDCASGSASIGSSERAVPAAVPGIVFLSGGQTDQQATEHLNAMNRVGDLPWQLSFSYGRALQAPVLKAWKGDTANVSAAQTAFHHRAWCNSKARFGKYTEDMETAKAA